MNHLQKLFETATQSGVLRDLGTRLQQGTRELAIEGGVGAARALVIAQAALAERRPMAVITAMNADARILAQELAFFVALLSPSPPRVVHLPSLEVDPYRGLSPHPEIAAARAGAIWQLLQDGPTLLVASARAAAMRLHQPQRFLSYCLELARDQSYEPELLREYLHESGYVEDDPVTDPGEFSLRGGILDIFPRTWTTRCAWNSSAIRSNLCDCSTSIRSGR